ncbi:MAG: hypothetical protein V7K83_30310 [Nostoc sp.]
MEFISQSWFFQHPSPERLALPLVVSMLTVLTVLLLSPHYIQLLVLGLASGGIERKLL